MSEEVKRLSLNEYLAKPVVGIDMAHNHSLQTQALKEWVWGLCDFGKVVLVKTCVAVSCKALKVWESYQDPDEFLRPLFRKPTSREALKSVKGWLKGKDDVLLQDIKPVSKELWSDVETLRLNINESPGRAEVNRARARVLYAISAVAYTAEAAIWDVEDVILKLAGSEADEVKAIISAGPAFETVEAVDLARLALDASALEMQEIIWLALSDL